jgi:hypothetical protein
MTDPAGTDHRLEDGPPAAPSGRGDDTSLDTDVEDVPLTRDQAIERDAADDDQQPARPSSDAGLLDRADPDGSA